MRYLVSILLLLTTSTLFGQDYSYSFSGELTPAKMEELNTSIDKIDGVKAFKIKYKENFKRGELILDTENIKERGEGDNSFSPIDVKKVFVALNLKPLQFKSL